jgi:hypothetical protein
MLSSVALLALQYVSTLFHKRHDFRKRVMENKMLFWFSLQLLSETFLILGRTERERWSKMYTGLPVKYRLFLSDFNNDTWICSKDFRKILKYQILWKSVRWEPNCSMRTDRRTCRSQYSLFAILRTRLNTGECYSQFVPKLTFRVYAAPNGIVKVRNSK